MSVRITPLVQGEYYHIYNRGNSKQTIFHDNADMQRFQDLLFIANNPERSDLRESKRKKGISTAQLRKGKTFAKGNNKEDKEDADMRRQDLRSCEGLASATTTSITISAITTSPTPSEFTRLVAIGSYCIMPNHFHILITPLVEGGVSKFMQKLSTAYPMYYNKRYTHTGGLFEGKFKAKHASDDRYLKYLFAYINLNPVKLIDPTWKKYGLKDVKKTFAFLETYTYSSYLDLLHREGKTFASDSRKRSEADILSLDEFPEYFPTGAVFKKEILTWFSYRDDF